MFSPWEDSTLFLALGSLYYFTQKNNKSRKNVIFYIYKSRNLINKKIENGNRKKTNI